MILCQRMVAAAASTALLTIAHTACAESFSFNGSGISGHLDFTAVPDSNTGPLGTQPNAYDPTGSYVLTSASGTFSDSNIGISGATITGFVASNPSTPLDPPMNGQPGNTLAPHSFGFYPVMDGVPGPGGTAPGLTYDNLFYPGGSPQTASIYPFHGGIFDIYGIVLKLSDGDAVNFWSNGDMGTGVTYGAAVTDGISVLDYASPVFGSVPEPESWSLMLLGFASVGGVVRKVRRSAQKLRRVTA